MSQRGDISVNGIHIEGEEEIVESTKPLFSEDWRYYV